MLRKLRNAGLGGRAVRLMVALALVSALSITSAQAQDVQIIARPLTPFEIHELHLTNAVSANGIDTIALGMPAYLEVQVEKAVGSSQNPVPVVVNSVTMSLDSRPALSAAALEASPIDLTVPIFDGGERQDFTAEMRKMLIPDVGGMYKVTAEMKGSTNGVPVTVPAEIMITGAKYMGVDGVCAFCHGGGLIPWVGDIVTPWKGTDHADFFTHQIDSLDPMGHYGESCIECHTVGYDHSPIVNMGFDDVAGWKGWSFPSGPGNNWDAMPAELKAKSNIQCENCHGPAGMHNGDPNKISISVSAGNCSRCHDEPDYHVKTVEWEQTLHATGYVFRDSGSCAPCHSTTGFIDEHDGDGKDTRGTGNEGVTCSACHDPHHNDHPDQLRTLANVTLGNGHVITKGGKGKLCMNCHKSRRDAVTYVEEYHSHYGPHHGPQADLLAGRNAIEYGKPMPSSSPHMNVPQTCVRCHMQDVEKDPTYGAAFKKVGGHTFSTTWDNDTPGNPADDVDVTKACLPCHVEDTFDFTFREEDHDGDNNVEGFQTEVAGLLEKLALLLPPVGLNEVDVTSAYTPQELKAAYNYLFVEEDGSHGLHNPGYAVAILQASIDDLNEPPPPVKEKWSDAKDLGGGFRSFDWFGTYYAAFWPWIYHLEHGIMMVEGTTTDDIRFFTLDMGYLRTTADLYPFMLRESDNHILWYIVGGTPAGRQFIDLTTGAIISVP